MGRVRGKKESAKNRDRDCELYAQQKPHVPPPPKKKNKWAKCVCMCVYMCVSVCLPCPAGSNSSDSR